MQLMQPNIIQLIYRSLQEIFGCLHVFKKQYVMFSLVLRKFTKIVEAYRKLVVGENGKLMVEFEDKMAAENLSSSVSEKFGGQALLIF